MNVEQTTKASQMLSIAELSLSLAQIAEPHFEGALAKGYQLDLIAGQWVNLIKIIGIEKQEVNTLVRTYVEQGLSFVLTLHRLYAAKLAYEDHAGNTEEYDFSKDAYRVAWRELLMKWHAIVPPPHHLLMADLVQAWVGIVFDNLRGTNYQVLYQQKLNAWQQVGGTGSQSQEVAVVAFAYRRPKVNQDLLEPLDI